MEEQDAVISKSVQRRISEQAKEPLLGYAGGEGLQLPIFMRHLSPESQTLINRGRMWNELIVFLHTELIEEELLGNEMAKERAHVLRDVVLAKMNELDSE